MPGKISILFVLAVLGCGASRPVVRVHKPLEQGRKVVVAQFVSEWRNKLTGHVISFASDATAEAAAVQRSLGKYESERKPCSFPLTLSADGDARRQSLQVWPGHSFTDTVIDTRAPPFQVQVVTTWTCSSPRSTRQSFSVGLPLPSYQVKQDNSVIPVPHEML